MYKIKVTADTFLAVINNIVNEPEINYTISDVSAPTDWKGKTVQEALNVQYYTFRHKPYNTKEVVNKLILDGHDADAFESLNRAFCLVYLKSTDRVFSRSRDVVTVSAKFEYWIQTEKIKLLEDMFEDLSINTIGEKIPVQIGSEDRTVIIALGTLDISKIEDATEFGEMAICEIDIDLVFNNDIRSIVDYKIEFLSGEKYVELPITSISISNSMTQKAVPLANQVRSVGSINLSNVRTIVMTFDGMKNVFIDNLISRTFNDNGDIDNNDPIFLRLTRGLNQYEYVCVIKEHSVIVQEDVGNETHNLVLTTRGVL